MTVRYHSCTVYAEFSDLDLGYCVVFVHVEIVLKYLSLPWGEFLVCRDIAMLAKLRFL